MKDILIRALKTFIQAFLGSLVVFIQGTQNFDEKAIKSALIGAFASALSCLMNFTIKLLEKGGK